MGFQSAQSAKKHWIKVWNGQYLKNKIPNIVFTKKFIRKLNTHLESQVVSPQSVLKIQQYEILNPAKPQDYSGFQPLCGGTDPPLSTAPPSNK